MSIANTRRHQMFLVLEPAEIERMRRFGEPRRYRNQGALAVRRRSTVRHLRPQTHGPHHLRFLRFAQRCRSHHRALHRSGDKARWWSAAGIEPIKVARRLWRKTRLPGTTRKMRADPGADVVPGDVKRRKGGD